MTTEKKSCASGNKQYYYLKGSLYEGHQTKGKQSIKKFERVDAEYLVVITKFQCLG